MNNVVKIAGCLSRVVNNIPGVFSLRPGNIAFAFLMLAGALCPPAVFAQQEKKPISQGNEFYKKQDFDKSAEAYNKALSLAPHNPLANYNMGNAQFRLNKFDDAIGRYNDAIANSNDKKETELAFYNKGVCFSKQHKLDESIEAYKEALKLNPKDQEARENLQKALLEKKKQDQQNKQDKNKDQQNDKKNQKNKKNDQKKQDKQKEDQQNENQNRNEEKNRDKKPKEQPSKLTPQQVEQILNAMAQKEKEVRQKLQENEKKKQRERAAAKPEKDW